MSRSNRRIRRLAITALVLLLCAATVVVVIMMRSTSRVELMAESRIEGMEAYAAGDYATVLARLSYYLTHERDDVEALMAFADARAKVPTSDNRHVMEAIELLSAVLTLDPANAEAQDRLLTLYERVGRRVEAQSIAERVLQRDPDDIDALRITAVGAYLDQHFEAAGQVTARLVELEPDKIEWRMFHLQILRDQNVPLNDMLALCEQWSEQYTGDGRYELVKAQVLAMAAQLDSAREAARRAAALGAASRDVLNQMISLLDSLQLRTEASDLIDATKDANPNEQWVYEAAVRRLWQANRFDEAFDELEQAAAHGPLGRELLRWQSLLCVLTDRYDEARESLKTLTELTASADDDIRDQDRAWIGAMIARMNWDEADWSGLLSAYSAALALAPLDPVLHFLVGETYMAVNEFELAAASLERAHRSDPHWYAARLAYVESLMSAGRPRSALDVMMESLRQTDEPSLSQYLVLARAWLAVDDPGNTIFLEDARTGRRVTLVELLQIFHHAAPEDATIRELLVRAALREGRRGLASDLIQDALESEREPLAFLLELAALSEVHQLGYEHQLIEAVRSQHELTPQVAFAQARLMHFQGDTNAGLALINQALRDPPQSPQEAAYHLRIRASYLSMIGHADAGRELRRLLDADAKSADNAAFVLSQSTTWSDEQLANQAIDQLAAIVGERSPRVAMARANFIMQFRSDDPAELARALVLVDDVLRQTPDSPRALNLMAQLYLAGDEPNANLAIRHMERSLARDPNQPHLLIQVVHLLQQRGDFAAAERHLRQLSALTLNDAAWRQAELQLLEAQGDVNQLIARLSERAEDELSETEQLMLVSQLHRAGRHDEARQRLGRMLASPQRSDLAVRLAAELHANLGRFDEGLKLLREHRPAGGEAARLTMIGRYFHDNDQAEQAKAHYEQALAADSGYVEALSHLAELHLALGDLASAHDVARRGLERDGENPSLQATLLTASLQLGGERRKNAMQLLANFESLDPALVDTLRLFDSITAADGSMRVPSREHLNDARRLTQKHPRFMPAWRMAVVMHVQAGQLQEAVRLATQATARMPQLAEPAQMATELLITAESLPEALDMARMWRERSLNRPLEADRVIAVLEMNLDRPRLAVAQLQPHAARFITERDEHPDRAVLWLQALLRSGDVSRAAEQFRPVFDDTGFWQGAWLELAGELDQVASRAALEIVSADFERAPQMMLGLATAWTRHGRRFDDPAALDRADALAASVSQHHGNLAAAAALIRAQTAEIREDDGAAEALYREALSAEPENFIALNNLAYLLVRQEKACEEAAELISRAINHASDVPEIYDTQAQVKLCLDDLAAAERSIRSALEVRPDSPDFLVTLGLVQARQDRWDDAAATLRDLERIDVPGAGLTDAQQRKVQRLRELITHRGRAAAGASLGGSY